MPDNKQEETKFSAEELQKVKAIQQNYVEIQHSLGQVSVARIRLDQQNEALETKEAELSQRFKDAQQEEKDFIAAVTEKYGDGVLNPETGIYNKTDEE